MIGNLPWMSTSCDAGDSLQKAVLRRIPTQAVCICLLENYFFVHFSLIFAPIEPIINDTGTFCVDFKTIHAK